MSNRDTNRISKDGKFGKGDDEININPDNEIPASSSLLPMEEEQNYESNSEPSTKPLVICARGGCVKAAIVHPDWDGDFCSRDCALMRCHEVFFRWVDSQKNGAICKNK